MASTYLSRTPTTESINKLTLSCWVKRSSISNNPQRIFSDSSSEYLFHRFETNDTFRFTIVVDAAETVLITNRKFRDTNAWYHIVVTWDTTQSTEADRIKLWVNGVQETSFSSTAYPALNSSSDMFNSATPFEIGRYDTANNEYFDGLMSHLHCCSGYAYDASTFGETDATTGIWKPKTAPSVTYGTNGFFLKFENSGSLGTDSSGNANNFTVNGTPTQTVDTPSNVFATLNPLEVTSGYSGSTSFTNGNTSISIGTANYTYGSSTIGVSKGKYYMEIKSGIISNSSIIGVVDLHDIVNGDLSFNSYAGGEPLGIAYFYDGRSITNDILSSYGDSWTNGDIIGVALDIDNGYIYFSKNGTWQNSGDPTSGATGTGALSLPTNSNSTGIWFFAPSVNNSSINCNFGNGYFGTTAVASGNADDNGLGIFEYAPPTGYLALCTKNINEQEYS